MVSLRQIIIDFLFKFIHRKSLKFNVHGCQTILCRTKLLFLVKKQILSYPPFGVTTNSHKLICNTATERTVFPVNISTVLADVVNCLFYFFSNTKHRL